MLELVAAFELAQSFLAEPDKSTRPIYEAEFKALADTASGGEVDASLGNRLWKSSIVVRHR